VCLAPWDSVMLCPAARPVGTVCSLAITTHPIVNVLCTAQYLVREMDVSWNRAATGRFECCACCEQHQTRVFIFCNEPLFPDSTLRYIAALVSGIELSPRILLIHAVLTPG